jgi:hypothetical protein
MGTRAAKKTYERTNKNIDEMRAEKAKVDNEIRANKAQAEAKAEAKQRQQDTFDRIMAQNKAIPEVKLPPLDNTKQQETQAAPNANTQHEETDEKANKESDDNF